MKRLGAIVTATMWVVLALPLAPASADGSVEAVTGSAGSSFHALSRLAPDERPAMTDDELAAVTGAAGGRFGLGGFVGNLGIVVQINVCAVCRNVTQSNVGAPRLGLFRTAARR